MTALILAVFLAVFALCVAGVLIGSWGRAPGSHDTGMRLILLALGLWIVDVGFIVMHVIQLVVT